MAVRRENDRIIFGGGLQTIILRTPNSDIINDGAIILDVTNLEFIQLLNTAPVTITSFKGGMQGRMIKLLGDGFTTIANNALIKTNTGVNKLLLINKIYTFTCVNNIYIENA